MDSLKCEHTWHPSREVLQRPTEHCPGGSGKRGTPAVQLDHVVGNKVATSYDRVKRLELRATAPK
jgi:hypothetical protein